MMMSYISQMIYTITHLFYMIAHLLSRMTKLCYVLVCMYVDISHVVLISSSLHLNVRLCFHDGLVC